MVVMYMNNKIMSFEKVKTIKEKYTDTLMDKQNVVGVGIGKRKNMDSWASKFYIKVYITKKLPTSLLQESDIIPKELDGVRVDIIETGKIRFLNNGKENGNQ
jgi:hypothetical protein